MVHCKEWQPNISYSPSLMQVYQVCVFVYKHTTKRNSKMETEGSGGRIIL